MERKHSDKGTLAEMSRSQLIRIESLSRMDRRPSLTDQVEYSPIRGNMTTDDSSSPNGSPTRAKDDDSSASSLSLDYQQSAPELTLVKKATQEDIYELKSKVKVKKRFKEGVPKSNLSDIKFKETDSLLENINSHENEFRGLYILFWLAVALLSLDILVNYYLEHGYNSEIVEYLASDLFCIGMTDLVMYLSIYLVFIVHWLVKAGWIQWETTGWWITTLYEVSFVLVYMAYAEHQNYPWIGKIFLFLHSLVLLMKMHSYAFYNGYMWNIHDELAISQAFLKKNNDNLLEPHIQEMLQKSIDFCSFEIKSQSKTLTFPENITLKNFFMYSMFPTVVYQIDFPRTPKVRWGFFIRKVCAIFGVIILMVVLAQHSMYPVAMRAIALRELPLFDRVWYYPKLLLDIIPSFLLMYLFVFYLIWDAILNALAEITCFGDREFYGPWWNCISWDEFARLWNVPVHRFLLRHVYHSSISAFNCSKGTATFLTFLISSVVHELSMYVLFHKLRGYLLLLQMFQLPLAAMSKTRWMRKQKTLGNVIFWFGIATGPSLMCTLYLTF